MNRFKLAREMRGNKSLDYVAKESRVSKNTIWKLERNMVDAGYSNVVKLANYYKVNVAWLMGQSESPSLNEDSQTVTQITGLSANAVSTLQLMKNNGLIDNLNSLLESDEFPKVVRWFKTARIINRFCDKSDSNTLIDDEAYQGMIEDTDGQAINNAWFPGESQIKMCIQRSTETLNQIYSKIMKEDKDNGTR